MSAACGPPGFRFGDTQLTSDRCFNSAVCPSILEPKLPLTAKGVFSRSIVVEERHTAPRDLAAWSQSRICTLPDARCGLSSSSFFRSLSYTYAWRRRQACAITAGGGPSEALVCCATGARWGRLGRDALRGRISAGFPTQSYSFSTFPSTHVRTCMHTGKWREKSGITFRPPCKSESKPQ